MIHDSIIMENFIEKALIHFVMSATKLIQIKIKQRTNTRFIVFHS